MYYLDTSFFAPLFIREPASPKIVSWVERVSPGSLHVSLWAKTEFASVLARKVRMKECTHSFALRVFELFGAWFEANCRIILPEAGDYELAAHYLLGSATGVRGGDALHLAIASNHGRLTVMTLDQGMIRAARRLDLAAQTGN